MTRAEQVLGVLSWEWTDIKAVVAALGVPYTSVHTALYRLKMAGVVESRQSPRHVLKHYEWRLKE